MIKPTRHSLFHLPCKKNIQAIKHTCTCKKSILRNTLALSLCHLIMWQLFIQFLVVWMMMNLTVAIFVTLWQVWSEYLQRFFLSAPPLKHYLGQVNNIKAVMKVSHISLFPLSLSLLFPLLPTLSEKSTSKDIFFLVLQLVKNRGLVLVPGRTEWYLEGPQ